MKYWDETWNPTSGCTPVSEGCLHCWAEAQVRLLPNVHCLGITHGPKAFRQVLCHEDRLDIPYRWKKPRKVAVCFLGDLFHADVPDEFISKVFAVTRKCPRHTFFVLTKRAARMADVCVWLTMPENVRVGFTAENQERFDERWLATQHYIDYVSIEPMLGPIVLGNRIGHLRWVLVGGESGPNARPMDPAWARSVRDQCKEAGIPFYMKQMSGAWSKGTWGPTQSPKIKIPDDLNIQEMYR